MKKIIHHGELIRKALTDKGIKAAWLSEQISYYNKKNIYTLFKKTCVCCQTIYEVSKALNHDLCKDIRSSFEEKEEGK
jgi:hypothetical protein